MLDTCLLSMSGKGTRTPVVGESWSMRRGAARWRLKVSRVRTTRRRSHKALYIPAFSLSLSPSLSLALWPDCRSPSVPESNKSSALTRPCLRVTPPTIVSTSRPCQRSFSIFCLSLPCLWVNPLMLLLLATLTSYAPNATLYPVRLDNR